MLAKRIYASDYSGKFPLIIPEKVLLMESLLNTLSYIFNENTDYIASKLLDCEIDSFEKFIQYVKDNKSQ